MLHWGQRKTVQLLRWSERYAKTDMVQFAQNNFWLTGGRVVAIGTGMLLTIAFANLLDPVLFGTYKYVLAAAGLVSAFSLSGMSASAMRVAAQGQMSAIPALTRILIYSSIPASLITFAVSCYYFYMGNSVLGWGFSFVALFNAWNNGYGLAKFAFSGAGDFKAQAFIGLPRTIFPVVVIIATLFVTHNVVYILFAYFVSNTLAAWIFYRWMLAHYHIEASSEHVEPAMRFGFHMSAMGFLQMGIAQLDQLLLWHFASPVALAVFSLAIAPVQQVMSFTSNFFSIAFPKLAVKTEEEVRRVLPLRLGQMFVVSCLVAAAYVLLAPLLFTILFPKYHASILASQVLAIMIVLQPKGFMDVFLTAHGKFRKRYVLIAITQVLDLIFTVSLIPLYGLWGAVIASILAEIAGGITLFIVYQRA